MTSRALLLLLLVGPSLAACAPPEEGGDAPEEGIEAPAAPPIDDVGLAPGKADDGLMTACARTAHIGDSLSEMSEKISKSAYAARGVTDLTWSAKGGRAILQTVRTDNETGRAAAQRIAADGFEGCWVIALGTNDTANIHVGANYSRATAIDRMMTAIDPGKTARVLWVNTYTKKKSGPWDNANMVLWNWSLEAARGRWPNLVVYDWAEVAATDAAPYSDGIHHSTAGARVRANAIADALATTWPR